MKTNWDLLTVALEMTVYGVVFWYLYDEVVEMRIQGYWTYFQEGWHIVDWSNLLMFLLVLYYKAINYLRFGSLFALQDDGTAKEQEVTANDIDVMGTSLIFQDQINGFNGFVLWLKLFRYISITQRIQRLSKVTVIILKDVAAFCVLFFVVAYAFVIFGHLLFKSKVKNPCHAKP